jgi:hypothetical protein
MGESKILEAVQNTGGNEEVSGKSWLRRIFCMFETGRFCYQPVRGAALENAAVTQVETCIVINRLFKL